MRAAWAGAGGREPRQNHREGRTAENKLEKLKTEFNKIRTKKFDISSHSEIEKFIDIFKVIILIVQRLHSLNLLHSAHMHYTYDAFSMYLACFSIISCI